VGQDGRYRCRFVSDSDFSTTRREAGVTRREVDGSNAVVFGLDKRILISIIFSCEKDYQQMFKNVDPNKEMIVPAMGD